MTEADIKQLHALADAVGVSRHWRDVNGNDNTVADEALATVIEALGYPAGSSAEIERSLLRAAEESRALPALLVTETGHPTPLPPGIVHAELFAEDGGARSLDLDEWMLPALDEPGYYDLIFGQHHLKLAVAPSRCHANPQLAERRMWGPSVQVSALRGARPQPHGNLGDLDDAVRLFAGRGADAVMINPMHALLPGTGKDYSPYSPSSKLFLNGVYADPALAGLPPLPARESGDLVDWAGAVPQRLADLREVFDGLNRNRRAAIAAECDAEGEPLRRQAIFDALFVRFHTGGKTDWRQWPAEFHDPENPAVERFAGEEADAVAFHMFVQWLTRQGLTSVQRTAKNSGMAIGLLADLAVGVRPEGSDAWAMRPQMLQGLGIGAPPDPLGPLGQNWHLTTFTPGGMRETGYASWIAMLRATLGWAGGMRIDHAFGLQRLWIVPDGEESRAGAYLEYPFEDLLGLAALESHRAEALIVAEDLGTKPIDFAQAIADKEMLGLRVLWFERAMDDGFIGPQDYEVMSVATTGTHDTATVAGWWSGRDLELSEKFERFPEGTSLQEQEEKREWDRGLLWATFGEPGPRPAPDDPVPALKAALRHIGSARSRLAIAPLEDLLAIEEQFNLPGVVEGYPNWRGRLASPLEELLDEPDTSHRIETLAQARRDGADVGE